MKDFAKSYEQGKWSFYAASYQRYKNLRDSSDSVKIRDICSREMERIEAMYPCLKDR